MKTNSGTNGWTKRYSNRFLTTSLILNLRFFFFCEQIFVCAYVKERHIYFLWEHQNENNIRNENELKLCTCHNDGGSSNKTQRQYQIN